MTIVVRAQNQRGNLAIDSEHSGYGYLGKVPIDYSNGYSLTANFNCVGFPLVFFNLPYNLTDGLKDGYPGSWKWGIALINLVNNGGNSWTANFLAQGEPNGTQPAYYLRVFGRVSDNWPNGSGRRPNFIVRNPNTNQVLFDAGVRMLRLAADTYNTEVVLPGQNPGYSEPYNKYDTSLNVGIDLNNKSVALTTRSMYGEGYYTGSYIDWDSGQTIDEWTVAHYNTLFAASGSSLLIKRVSTSENYFEATNPVIFYGSPVNGISRLAIIDNSKFP